MINIFNKFTEQENVKTNMKTATNNDIMMVTVNERHHIILNRRLDYNVHENIINIFKSCGVKDEHNIWIDKKGIVENDVMLPVNKSIVVNTIDGGKINITHALYDYRLLFDDFETKILYVPVPKSRFDEDFKFELSALEQLDCIIILGYQMDNIE